MSLHHPASPRPTKKRRVTKAFLEHENKTLKRRVKNLEWEVDFHIRKINNRWDDITELQFELQDLESKLTRLQFKLEVAQDENDELESKVDKRQDECTTLKTEIKKLQAERDMAIELLNKNTEERVAELF